MTDYSKMVGTRGSSRPELTIAGHLYTRADGECNLGYGKFCVLDNRLSTADRDSVLAALRAYVKPPKRRKKADEDTDNDEPA